jgi:hypothetical protein
MTEEKKTTKRKLALVQSPIEEKPETPETDKQPVQIIAKHTEIAWHSSVNGLECYDYTSQEILDVADRVYSLFQKTPIIFIYGECMYGDKVIRLSQEQAVCKNIPNGDWHLPYAGIDVAPINGTFARARVGVTRPGTFEQWEETAGRKVYRAKLQASIQKA